MRTPSRRALLLTGLGALAAACAGSTRRAQPEPQPTAGDGPAAAPATAAPGGVRPSSSAPTGGHRGPAVEVAHGPRDRKEVALTFHAAGDPRLAEQVLRSAEAVGASLTVMAIGTWLDATPALARRVLSGNHELGNHTQRHLSDLATQPESVVRQEFAAVAATLTRLTGSPGAFARPSAMQHGTPAVLAAAGELGYARVLSYDVDPEDYRDPGADLVVSRTLAAVRPGSVVSLHLGHPGTVAAMPRLLAGLAERGLAVVSATQLLRTA